MSYFLLENETSDYSQSRFFAGTDYYSFPYTKFTFSESLSWDSGSVTYESWDWQTNYVSLYSGAANANYNAARKKFETHHFYVTN